MKTIMKQLAFMFFDKFYCVYENEKNRRMKNQLGSCGVNVSINSGCSFIPPQNCFVGNDVFFGAGGKILSTDSKVQIGDKVMFGPEFMIITGDHRTNLIGNYMFDVKEKEAGNDSPVVIKDDVWIGARAIILKGVTISEGSIVAAGSVVTKSVPPFSVVGGVPAKVLHKRFSDEEIQKHKIIMGISGDNK